MPPHHQSEKVEKFHVGNIRDSLSQTPRTLRLAWSLAPWLCGLMGFVTLVAAVLPVGVAFAAKMIIDAVVQTSQGATYRAVALELAAIVALASATRALGLMRQLLGARLSLDINVLILNKAQSLDLHHFENPTFYDQLTRARREASSRPLQVVTDTFLLMQNLLTLMSYMALLLAYSPWVVLGLGLASLPAAVAEIYFSSVAFRLRNWRSPEARLQNYIEYVLSNDAHAKEVKIFGLGPSLLDRYRMTGEKLFHEDQGLVVKRTTWAFLLSLMGTIVFYGCYLSMALAAVAGVFTLGTLTLYVVAFRQGQQAFQSVLQAVGGMFENNLYMSNLFKYLGIKVSKEKSRVELEHIDPLLSEEKGIRFEKVGFRYPDQEKWALKSFDLFVPQGQSLALVGRNGAGKSTLIKLLTRLYEPTEGRILLDGKDLKDWDLQKLHARQAVVFQDFNRYHFSLEENVHFGSIDDVGDEAQLLRALDKGGARDLVRSLERGVKTPLGRWFDKGTELSGGQWQKVALARGFMREKADILVLDEPTSALDAQAEFVIFERFMELTRGRTSFLISHRFPTIRMADRIVLIEDGQITEAGTHVELVDARGKYAELFALQAKGYL